MENNKNIILIALAVFSIVILLAQNNIEKVFALTSVDQSVAIDTGSAVDYQGGFAYVVGAVSSNTTTFYKYNTLNGNLTTSINIGGDWNGITCSGQGCISSSSHTKEFVRLSPTLTVLGYFDSAGPVDYNGMDLEGSTLVYVRTSGANRFIEFADLGCMCVTATYLTSMGATVTRDLQYLPTLNRIVIINDGSTLASFQIWNTISSTQVCQTNVGAGLFSVIYDSVGTRYLATGASSVQAYTTACANSAFIASIGSASTVDINIDTARNEVSILTGSSGTMTIYVVDRTTGNIEITLGAGSGGTFHYMTYDSTRKVIVNIADTTNIVRFWYIDKSPEELAEGEGSESEADNNCATNPETVFCRLGGSNDNSTKGFGGLIRDGIVTLGCNIAFVDCQADDNPATNGLGLLIFIASVFVVVGMFYWATGRDAFHLPLFIWVLIIIALSAFFTIVGIIDPVFLIISIIAIVALAAPKVLSTLRGSTFGGGSTE